MILLDGPLPVTNKLSNAIGATTVMIVSLCFEWQVEELRQQIRVLQAVGYGSMDAEDGPEGSANGGAAHGGVGHVGNLESLLLAKARRLEHELTMARLRLSEVSGEISRSCPSRAGSVRLCFHLECLPAH
jgi:hypothetical protein